ncbi:excalibur calcium-binding domain-containing protein [Erythrobacter sp. SCSIO 43205]|uniref:excalibur calcium-binding domain-containing protein n=1 Tax=Erythrobacter sp. SCSIO 43205 TaxID=2779361 RepID=UPI00351D3BF6|nr:excalibur calcium-binding domain-containing protein [Erythrobacter sp. SCSIO 43205]
MGKVLDRSPMLIPRRVWLSPVIVFAVTSICFVPDGSSSPAQAHPGGLAADGCHNDRKNGGRHCHRGSHPSRAVSQTPSGNVYYPNCAAARQAGRTPLLRGQPGYGSHLDRDGDGRACE